MPKAGKCKKKAANGYKRPEPIPEGEVLEDVAKKKWILGPSIGQGGFGEIYSAKEYGSKDLKYPYALKIELHENGPLWVEMHFYIKNAKEEDVEEFREQKGLKTFGMPIYLGSGSHDFNGEKYRFLVMEKFGTDLWKIFLENDRHFPAATVFKLAVQILDVLEYIHGRGYVHSDIKGSNILMGVTKATQNKQVYLADFGLAFKCNEDEEFTPNPKKAHDGTIEYLSRDAHNGVQTKRGDLESLAYNLIQWLGCVLPWENDLKDPVEVQKSKEEYMSSVPKFIKACFDKRSPSGPIVDFLNCLLSLEHNSTPDYKTIRKIFLSGITGGDALGKPFQFTVPDSKSPKSSPGKRKSEHEAASSKKKIPKLDIEDAASSDEDEKENLDDLSDKEEVPKKAKGRPRGTPKGKKVAQKEKKAVGRKKTKKVKDEDEDLDLENNLESGDVQVSDIEDGEEVTKKEEKVVEPKENKNPRGRKKAKKEVNGKGYERLMDDENDDQPQPVHEVPTRSTRQRGSRTVNYKEDSDDEDFFKRKPRNTPAPKEVKNAHITDDETETSTSQQKKKENTKKKAASSKPVEEETEEMSDGDKEEEQEQEHDDGEHDETDEDN